MEFLSDIELYYSVEKSENLIYVSGEEKNHACRVMRHEKGDLIHITDGKGQIYICSVSSVQKDILTAEIIKSLQYQNQSGNICFCIPKLRNPERLEFALEKCTELGITNFIVFNAAKGVAKGDKKDRWEKILISAMKQSIRSFKPVLTFIDKIVELNSLKGQKIILDQKANESLQKFSLNPDRKYYFIFGPEGGLDKKEVEVLVDKLIYNIAPNRLRSETAIVKAAAILDF